MGADIKKIFWIITAIGIIAVMAAFIVTPIVTQIKNQKPEIEKINFSQGTSPAPAATNP